MLLLCFDLDADRYALDVRQVIEVLPLAHIAQIPDAPRGVAGVLNYRGDPVPVIDLTALMLGRPSRAHWSTRLIVVHVPDQSGRMRVLGLLAEHATDTLRRPDADFVASGIATDQTPYLGQIATDAHGIVQLVEISGLLPPSVRDVLFRQAAEH